MHFTPGRVLYLLSFSFLIFNIVAVSSQTILRFTPSNITIQEGGIVSVAYNITNITDTEGIEDFLIYSEDESIASVDKINLTNLEGNLSGFFNVSGNVLGKTTVACRNLRTNVTIEGTLNVIVTRKQRVIDTVFTVSVAILVSIIYINFGCAINWTEFLSILKKPTAPSIGFCGQFILMPLISYGIGQILFPDSPEMQLGIFFTGVAPGGGASNLWTVLLEGNVSLSIIMTTLSTIAAFGTMPLWIFTLGKLIFDKGNLEVPYFQITTYVVTLVIPLAVGFLIQRYFKKFSEFMKRILKGLSVFLLVFIIIFASATNLYLFKLFSWKIVIAAMALPWVGYILGYTAARLFKQSYADCITIAVEIGIQNTGIPIFLLRFALPQPEADLTTIVPVSVSIFTPFPLIFFLLCLKIRDRWSARKTKLEKKAQANDFGENTESMNQHPLDTQGLNSEG